MSETKQGINSLQEELESKDNRINELELQVKALEKGNKELEKYSMQSLNRVLKIWKKLNPRQLKERKIDKCDDGVFFGTPEEPSHEEWLKIIKENRAENSGLSESISVGKKDAVTKW